MSIRPMSSRPIRFFHRGAVVEVDAAPTRTVLDWLREQVRDVARNLATHGMPQRSASSRSTEANGRAR